MEVFTPLEQGRAKRLSFSIEDVNVLSGNMERRGLGLKAIVEIHGQRYKVIGRACSLPNCQCDAELIPISQ